MADFDSLALSDVSRIVFLTIYSPLDHKDQKEMWFCDTAAEQLLWEMLVVNLLCSEWGENAIYEQLFDCLKY